MNVLRIVILLLLAALAAAAMVLIRPVPGPAPERVMPTAAEPAVEPAVEPVFHEVDVVARELPPELVPVESEILVRPLEERGDAMLYEIDVLQDSPFDHAVILPFN